MTALTDIISRDILERAAAQAPFDQSPSGVTCVNKDGFCAMGAILDEMVKATLAERVPADYPRWSKQPTTVASVNRISYLTGIQASQVEEEVQHITTLNDQGFISSPERFRHTLGMFGIPAFAKGNDHE